MKKIFSLWLCLLPAAGLYAQSEVGGATLNGTITDPSGAAVAGAKVTAVDQGTGFARRAISNESGLYSLIRLPVGTYTLTVEQKGFQIAKRTDIALNVGAVATVDVRLAIGAAQEVVSVTAEVPVVETTRSQTSNVVNEKSVANLPINGRNFLDIAVSAPGVVRDPRGGDLSFAGQRGTFNSVLVDGADGNNLFFGQSSGRAGVRNPYSFSQDSVQEFKINNSGYNSETCRARDGAVNVLTTSGSNGL